MIMILFILNLQNIAVMLFTDLLISIILIYIVLFVYKSKYKSDENLNNLEFYIKIILITPFFFINI